MSLNYIYIIQTRESIEKNDNVYKVGMTKCGPKNRISSYGTNSRLISITEVKCAKTTEKLVLSELKKHFQQDRSYGIEYFKVYNINKLLTIVNGICNKNLVNNISNSTVNIESLETIVNIDDPIEQIQNSQIYTNDKDLLKNNNITPISKYTCVRCGHGSSQLGDLRKHLNKSKECIGYFDNTSRKILLEMLAYPKDYINYLQKNKISQILETSVKPIENNLSKSINNALTLSKPNQLVTIHKCIKCGREFSSRQSRWYHEKHCKETQVNTDNIDSDSINIVGSNNADINSTNNTINNNINFSKLYVYSHETISPIII